MLRFRIITVIAALSLLIFVDAAAANATTKGLNQIVTPDIQPEGVLSVSFQQTDPNITNQYQAQFEYGFTKNLEAAVFQGFSPDEETLNVEYGIVQQPNFLLSTGFANWSTTGVAPQPYLEAGFLKGNSYAMIGVTEQGLSMGASGTGAAEPISTDYSVHQIQSLLGFAYRVHPRLLLQVDYQGGGTNFTTAGFTYSITPTLQFNPAIYVTNSSPYKGYGYAVLTWNITVHD